MSNSPLISYTKLSPNHSGNRTHDIDRTSIHCMAGNLSVESCGALFAQSSRQASSNYGIGSDGRKALYVPEAYRSWCTSSNANDQRAVTIEVASDATHPYKVTDQAYSALLDLVTDICKRNGKTKILWFGDKNKTLAYTPKENEMVMTVHRWFAAKACPGDYLYNLHDEIAAEVNKRLSGGAATSPSNPNTGSSTGGQVSVNYTVRVKVTDLNIRTGPGTNYGKKGFIQPGIYTIVAEADGAGASKWGRLKSGAGWIALDYVEKTGTSSTKPITEGDKVKVLNAITYTGGKFTAYFDEYDVLQVDGDRVVIGIGRTVTAAVNIKNLQAV